VGVWNAPAVEFGWFGRLCSRGGFCGKLIAVQAIVRVVRTVMWNSEGSLGGICAAASAQVHRHVAWSATSKTLGIVAYWD
jgi:hypothetical protein